MKAKKLLARLNSLMGLEEGADKSEIRKLREVLKALKAKQAKLEAKLEGTEGEHERRKIRQKLEVIKQQRQKGVKVYLSLKAGQDGRDAQ